MTPETDQALPKTMQSIGVRYVRYFNTTYDRTGGLWDGRYQASLVTTDHYLQACYRYIELNPVRAGLVADPADWIWSSHRFHALGQPDRVVSKHGYYADLGDSDHRRQTRYKTLFREQLTEHELESIRETIRGELVLGDDAVKRHLEVKTDQPPQLAARQL
jgi:putative transposase